MSTLSVSKNLVAVFVGGTSGVGQGMAEVFNRHTNGNSHIVLVGRNRDAAERIISNMKAAFAQESSTGSYEFVPCDVSVSSNVKNSASNILAKHSKINYLILSPGFLSPNRVLTEEGIDKKLVLHYYGRWTFIHELLPALRSAKLASEDAKVMTILSPSTSGKINLDDLGLIKDFSISGAAVAASLYNNLMCEEYAVRNPDVVFAHASPGTVRTNLLKASDASSFRIAHFFLPLFYPFTVSTDQCGEYLWSGLNRCAPNGAGSAGVPGAYRIGSKGEDLGPKGNVLSSKEREALWKHTLEVTKTIDD